MARITIASLQSELNLIKHANTELRKQLDLLQAEVDTLTAKNNGLANRNKNLEDLNAVLREDLATVKKDLVDEEARTEHERDQKESALGEMITRENLLSRQRYFNNRLVDGMHEMNTPLQTIKAIIQYAQDRTVAHANS